VAEQPQGADQSLSRTPCGDASPHPGPRVRPRRTCSCPRATPSACPWSRRC
jgi:hypothetical protein